MSIGGPHRNWGKRCEVLESVKTIYGNLGMLCMACYLMFKHRVCWKCQYNKYMFNFIDNLHFYS